MNTVLFFDDLRLNRRDNVTRGIGRPRRIPESRYQDPNANVAWGYPSVFHVPEERVWRMTYLGWAPDGKRLPLLAESADGIHWTPRAAVDRPPIPNRILPNQLLPLDEFGEWPACYVDPHADPAERIKGLVVFHTSKNYLDTRLWVSPNGLEWTLKEGVRWQEKAPDPGVGVFWNAVRQSYVLTTRPDWTDRRVAVFETRDWKSFSIPELALQADALDTPLAEIYGMPVFPYEGIYVGFAWLYHAPPQVPGHSPHKFLDGPVDCQLAYSLNGWHFQRTLREPFMPNGEPGEPDAGCLYPSSLVSLDNGDLRIYASGSPLEHGYNPAGSGSISAYHMRRDGFVFLAAARGEGCIGTRPVLVQGKRLELNVQAPHGQARVQLTGPDGHPIPGFGFADCTVCSEDLTAWRPTWKERRDMESLIGKTVRIEVSLGNGRIYAIRGDFLPLIAGDCWRYNEDRQHPPAKPGF